MHRLACANVAMLGSRIKEEGAACHAATPHNYLCVYHRSVAPQAWHLSLHCHLGLLDNVLLDALLSKWMDSILRSEGAYSAVLKCRPGAQVS